MDVILIAEDDEKFQKILGIGLKKYEDKFKVVTTGNGEEAVEALKRESISLLVTDLLMPKMDGLQLLAYMNEHHPETPCIVMTAHGTPRIKKKLQEDVLSYIEKPFKPDDLARVILPALDKGVPGGALRGISIASFLQMIEMEEKTCLIEVEDPAKKRGIFYCKKGALYDALCGESKGVDAALEIISMENLKIRFKNLPSRQIAR
ncbi:MAG: response regulator, partial [Desulfobacterales bacterium]|nr:response regulator [Desulfobacterales bacterium]